MAYLGSGISKHTSNSNSKYLLMPRCSVWTVDSSQAPGGFQARSMAAMRACAGGADPWICVVNSEPLFLQGAASGHRSGRTLSRAFEGTLLQKATCATVRSMSRIITQRELRNNSGAILREVQAGQSILVSRNGVPVAELRPVPQRTFVPRAVIADAAVRAPRIDSRRFRSDIDAVVDDSING
jgi:prevent-host-death family protein